MKRFIKTLLHNLLLAFLAFVWLVPIVWLVVTSFSAYTGMNTSTFFPKEWSLAQYKNLLFSADSVAQFPNWFKNTFHHCMWVCVISTAFVLMVAYATSCMRFPARKPLMNAAVIVNLFPGVLSMIAVYFILKTLNLPLRTDPGIFCRRRTGLPDRKGLLRYDSEFPARGCFIWMEPVRLRSSGRLLSP